MPVQSVILKIYTVLSQNTQKIIQWKNPLSETIVDFSLKR